MFLLFFNRGFVFKIELRYLPDTYTGTVKPTDPKFCLDETPIFAMIAKKLGGTVIAKGDHEELTQYNDKYVMSLTTGTGVHDANLSWALRGGPSSPNL